MSAVINHAWFVFRAATESGVITTEPPTTFLMGQFPEAIDFHSYVRIDSFFDLVELRMRNTSPPGYDYGPTCGPVN